jgi:hypothetical protein
LALTLRWETPLHGEGDHLVSRKHSVSVSMIVKPAPFSILVFGTSRVRAYCARDQETHLD